MCFHRNHPAFPSANQTVNFVSLPDAETLRVRTPKINYTAGMATVTPLRGIVR